MEEAALLPRGTQPEWKGKESAKALLRKEKPCPSFLQRVPRTHFLLSLPVGHSSSSFSLPGEGFLKHKSGPATPPPTPYSHTHPCLKFFNGSPFAQGWTRSRHSSTIIHGLSDSGLQLAVRRSSCLPICYTTSRFSPSPGLCTGSSLHGASFPPPPTSKPTKPSQNSPSLCIFPNSSSSGRMNGPLL